MKLHSPIATYLCFYHIWLVAALVLLMALAAPAKALDIDGAEILSGNAVEGGLIIARTNPSNQIMLDDDAIEIAKNGVFVIGFHRDSDSPVKLRIIAPDGSVKTSLLSPRQRDYNIQRIDGLKSTMVTPPATVLARIKSDGDAVRTARQRKAPLGDFWRGFDWPALGRISGIYGSQRILNGAPRAPHYGIDIAAAKGTPVLAPAGGRITLVKELYFSGWTVLITHGFGLNAAFLHMDSVSVTSGDVVRRGTQIGTVGSTGRSTGPHLDWRLDWRIDRQRRHGRWRFSQLQHTRW